MAMSCLALTQNLRESKANKLTFAFIIFSHRQSEGRLDFPLDICLTEYHILLLYTNGIAAISLFEHDRKSETKQTPAFKDFFTVSQF